MLDDGSVYNVDTAGVIWYQAASSFVWRELYRCRNYIPWSGGVGRLDHVMRDERGFPGDGGRLSSRVPAGRPMSGSFIGFQTDVTSCVVFLHGKIVYEGEYRSDCDAELVFSNQDGCYFYNYDRAAYRNWLTHCSQKETGVSSQNTEVRYSESNFVVGARTPTW